MFFVCIQWEKLIRWHHSSKGQAQKPLYSFLSFLWTFYSGSYLQNEELSRLLNGKWTGSYIMLFYCASVLQTQTHKHTYTCTSTFSIYILLDIYSNNLGKGTDLVLLPQKKFCFVSVFVFLFFLHFWTCLQELTRHATLQHHNLSITFNYIIYVFPHKHLHKTDFI